MYLTRKIESQNGTQEVSIGDIPTRSGIEPYDFDALKEIKALEVRFDPPLTADDRYTKIHPDALALVLGTGLDLVWDEADDTPEGSSALVAHQEGNWSWERVHSFLNAAELLIRADTSVDSSV